MGWINNDILETKKVIINFANETIIWKPFQYNPKESIKFKELIKRSNNVEPISINDFE